MFSFAGADAFFAGADDDVERADDDVEEEEKNAGGADSIEPKL